jgi:hypothetical protein
MPLVPFCPQNQILGPHLVVVSSVLFQWGARAVHARPTPVQSQLTQGCCCHAVQTRMRKLEALRLEVDSRRRTVQALTLKVDKQRANLPKTRAKGEEEMQSTIKSMQHKENKLAGERGTLQWFQTHSPASVAAPIVKVDAAPSWQSSKMITITGMCG